MARRRPRQRCTSECRMRARARYYRDRRSSRRREPESSRRISARQVPPPVATLTPTRLTDIAFEVVYRRQPRLALASSVPLLFRRPASGRRMLDSCHTARLAVVRSWRAPPRAWCQRTLTEVVCGCAREAIGRGSAAAGRQGGTWSATHPRRQHFATRRAMSPKRLRHRPCSGTASRLRRS